MNGFIGHRVNDGVTQPLVEQQSRPTSWRASIANVAARQLKGLASTPMNFGDRFRGLELPTCPFVNLPEKLFLVTATRIGHGYC